MKGEFVIVDRHWADEKDEKNNKIYVGVVRYEGQGKFDGQTVEVRIPYTPNTKAGRALDDMVNRANHGLGHVQDDLKIKTMEEFMRAAGRSYSARLMRRLPEE